MNGLVNGKGLWEKASKLLKGDKKVKILFLLGIVGMLFILLSEVMPQKTKAPAADRKVMTAEEYCDFMQQKIASLVSSIDGAGKCEVLLTLENGVESVYMMDVKTSNDKTQEGKEGADGKIQEKTSSEEKVIIVDGKEGEQGLISKEIEPKIRGVVVVCEGGGDVMVTQRVTSAVTTAFHISSARVFVTRLEGTPEGALH